MSKCMSVYRPMSPRHICLPPATTCAVSTHPAPCPVHLSIRSSCFVHTVYVRWMQTPQKMIQRGDPLPYNPLPYLTLSLTHFQYIVQLLLPASFRSFFSPSLPSFFQLFLLFCSLSVRNACLPRPFTHANHSVKLLIRFAAASYTIKNYVPDLDIPPLLSLLIRTIHVSWMDGGMYG